ncbi:MAG: histidinol dehydrogenase [Alphaproteobacteria bacterium]
MSINYLAWHETDDAIKSKILRRSESDIGDLASVVAPIIAAVKQEGDAAIARYTHQLDGAPLDAGIKVTEAEFLEAETLVSAEIKEALKVCIAQVKSFHEAQMARIEKRWLVEVGAGVWAGEQVNPLPSVALYVPRGKGSFPSVMYMLCVPAVIAGVRKIAVCTPPNPDGRVDAASLVAARLCGVHDIYKVGGAQAIAALAYGTKTVPKVDKVIGPGNAYVAAARRQLADLIDPGMPAGPSEAIILADATANVHNTSLDVLNEAEHGPDSASLLVTPSRALAEAVRDYLPALIEALPEPRRGFCTKGMGHYGGIILTRTMEEAIAFCNDYAVEHLHLKVENPDEILPQLTDVGEILIGEYAPIALGNYGIGVNAILPTGRHARTHSATGVWDFLKRTTIAKANREGYDRLAAPVVALAEYEGFPSHSATVKKRLL